MPTVERVTESFSLGEGPHWDTSTKSLYFVDIPGKNIVRYVPSTKKVTKASTAPQSASFIIPVENKKDHFVIGANNQLVIISWDGESDKYTTVETLKTVEKTAKAPNLGFNDAKCDSTGRLWAGALSMASEIAKTEPVGTLYSLDGKQFKSHLEGIRLSNGLAFNDKAKKFFYIDSLKGTVDRFDLDINTGTISNREEWFTVKKAGINGLPDGMTIDTDGNLWVAVFGSAKVLKVDGSTPETLLDSVEIPAEQVTSVAFGGTNLDELYVTTGCLEMQGKKLEPPANGATYKITGTGSKGHPASNFKWN